MTEEEQQAKAEADAAALEEQKIVYLRDSGVFRLNMLRHMARNNDLLEKQNKLLTDIGNRLLSKLGPGPGRPKKKVEPTPEPVAPTPPGDDDPEEEEVF